MTTITSALCSFALLTSLGCLVLLFRSYAESGLKILLWTALCFVFLAANNVLLFVDVVVYPQIDLRIWRFAVALLGIAVLLYGFTRRDA